MCSHYDPYAVFAHTSNTVVSSLESINHRLDHLQTKLTQQTRPSLSSACLGAFSKERRCPENLERGQNQPPLLTLPDRGASNECSCCGGGGIKASAPSTQIRDVHEARHQSICLNVSYLFMFLYEVNESKTSFNLLNRLWETQQWIGNSQITGV